MTTALKSAASGQPGPAAYSSRTVKGAARASRPDSANNDGRTAPAETRGHRRRALTASRIPCLPRPAAAERCGGIGSRTQPRHDALRPYARSPRAIARARLRAARRGAPSGTGARAPRPAPARPKVAPRVGGMRPLQEESSSALNGSTFGANRAGRGGAVGTAGAVGAAADSVEGLSTCVTETPGPGEGRSGEAVGASARRTWRAATAPTAAPATANDAASAIRNRRRPRAKRTGRAAGNGRSGAAWLASRRAMVARPRARARARSFGGHASLDRAVLEEGLQLRFELGIAALHVPRPSLSSRRTAEASSLRPL